jgi:hypothetical protein
MSSTLRYNFPSRDQRNHFLGLIAQNIGAHGYGFGLEFEGIEYKLEHSTGQGSLISHMPPRAKGDWYLRENNVVELDVAFFQGRPNFEKTRTRIWEIACQFGAG